MYQVVCQSELLPIVMTHSQLSGLWVYQAPINPMIWFLYDEPDDIDYLEDQ